MDKYSFSSSKKEKTKIWYFNDPFVAYHGLRRSLYSLEAGFEKRKEVVGKVKGSKLITPTRYVNAVKYSIPSKEAIDKRPLLIFITALASLTEISLSLLVLIL